MITVRITKRDPRAQLPEYQTAGAAAFDLAIIEDAVVAPRSQALLRTGLGVGLPVDHVLHIYARSSLFKKHGLVLANGVGVVDPDYSGPDDEILLSVWNPGDEDVVLTAGTRIAQGIILGATARDLDRKRRRRDRSRWLRLDGPRVKAYLEIARRILDEGERKENRTGIDTIAIAGAMFEHDMAKGFPLLTTKKTPFRLVATELEFFIKGITDKWWLQSRNNHIWDEWANPRKAPYGHDDASKKRMMEERDLGPVYGFQWRHFGAPYVDYATDYTGQGVDQLKHVVDTLRSDPNDRRMIVNAWNPTQLSEQGLPPCHFVFQVTVINGQLNLLWNQRSVDVPLGLPFNIASYGLLLHLLAMEAGLREGKLIGFLADTHIYVNQIDGIIEQLTRDPDRHPLPRVVTHPFGSIWDWTAEHTRIEGYASYPKIDFPIAV